MITGIQSDGPIVFGVHEVTGGDIETLRTVFAEDYSYLVQAYPEFLFGHLVRSTTRPDHYFHLTCWVNADALAKAKADPAVAAILSGLPAATVLVPEVCELVTGITRNLPKPSGQESGVS